VLSHGSLEDHRTGGVEDPHPSLAGHGHWRDVMGARTDLTDVEQTRPWSGSGLPTMSSNGWTSGSGGRSPIQPEKMLILRARDRNAERSE
jgi:hypothetical protein